MSNLPLDNFTIFVILIIVVIFVIVVITMIIAIALTVVFAIPTFEAFAVNVTFDMTRTFREAMAVILTDNLTIVLVTSTIRSIGFSFAASAVNLALTFTTTSTTFVV